MNGYIGMSYNVSFFYTELQVRTSMRVHKDRYLCIRDMIAHIKIVYKVYDQYVCAQVPSLSYWRRILFCIAAI